MSERLMLDKKMAMIVLLCAGAILADSAGALPDKAEAAKVAPKAATQAAPIAGRAAALPGARPSSPYRPGVPTSSKVFYQAAWGIDNMLVRQMASGNLIRFSYRVTNPTLAKPLGDKQATPLLYGQRSRALLHIPVMDKVGQLRQSGTALAGREYWMVFSNKGNLVKPGDRVNVVIGAFHADGLMVE